VGDKLDANGEGTRFGWKISLNKGFQIYKKNTSGT
jgi:hypothetical protein